MTTQTQSANPLGSLIRMRALPTDQLPSHPDLAPQQQNAPDLPNLVSSILDEAETFVKTYLPQHFSVKDANKQSPPSQAPVKLYSRDINTADLPKEAREAGGSNEAWFARVSVHENAAKDGTASWEEFDGGLRENHSQHEKDYTPDVYDAHEIMNWNERLEELGRKVGDWNDVHVALMEMAHHIPAPLNNRVFPVLVVTARKEKEFIVAQIPIATKGLPNAKYHNVPKVTGGMYCSIELGELIDDGKNVRWSMATASDAKGSLPMWMQKMGVPGAVVKDVGFFIGWCAKRRKGDKP